MPHGSVTPEGRAGEGGREHGREQRPRKNLLRRLASPFTQPEWKSGTILAGGLIFGAMAGLLETAPLAFLRFSTETVLRMSRHFLWMTPVADAALFVAVAAALAAVGLVWRRVRSRSFLLGIFAGLTALCLMLLVEVIHDAASLVLAAGVGVQVARHATGRRTRRFLRAMPVLAPLLLVSVGGLGWWSFARDHAREQEQIAVAPAAPADSPNVLLLILDTVRASAVGLYGESAWTSPELEALAPRGVFFERAIAPAPWTLPSHAAMFTGHWPHELGIGWDPLGPGEPTLAEQLASEGYATVGFVGNLLYASRQSGLARGFGVYEDYPVGPGQVVLSSSLGRALAYNDSFRRLIHHHALLNRRTAPELNRDFLSWIDDREGEEARRPWFAFLNYYEAHEPHFPPDSALDGHEWNEYAHRGGIFVGGNAWRANKSRMTLDEARIHAHSYHAAVRKADAATGELVAALEERGLLENTLVIITSDHGEQLGEHNLFGHNNSLYINTLHVPLLMIWPDRLPAGQRISEAVSLRDLPATILDLLGAESTLPGESLAPSWTAGAGDGREFSPAISFLTQGPEPQPYTPIGRAEVMQSIVRIPYHYIHTGDGTDALYHLIQDPHELRNLAGTPAGDSALVPIRADLYELITGQPPPDDIPINPYRPRRPPQPTGDP